MFIDAEVALLRRYVSDPTSNVFVVFPEEMAGIIGAVYARYSRTDSGFRETLLREFVQKGQLNPLHADQLIARILIEYGDDSVQEFESAWLSLEEISNIATKAIESRRLASYIEKSTRYVFYDERDENGRFRYLREPTIMASYHAKRFESVMDLVFETYSGLIAPLQEYFRRKKPLGMATYEIRAGKGKISYAGCGDDRERRDFKRTWQMDIHAKTCDTIRILLPFATLTNLGIYANGRTLENSLRHLYSSDLPELQDLAQKAHVALKRVIPRYVQRACRSEYLVETGSSMQILAWRLLNGVPIRPSSTVDLLEGGFTKEGQLAAMLYPYSEHPFRQLIEFVCGLPEVEQQRVLETYLGRRRTRRDRPGRALEFGYPWLVDLMIDGGVYRDLQRHRMLTQERQLFTTRLGFCDFPAAIIEAGFADQIQKCVDTVASLYEAIRSNLGPEVAQYVVLFGFKVRCFMGFNDREAQHLLELRTQPQGHSSYREVCQEVYRQMLLRDPWRVKPMMQFVDLNSYEWPRADSEARQRDREAMLEKV